MAWQIEWQLLDAGNLDALAAWLPQTEHPVGRADREALTTWLVHYPYGPAWWAKLVDQRTGKLAAGAVLLRRPFQCGEDAVDFFDPVVVAVPKAYRTLGPVSTLCHAIVEFAQRERTEGCLATPTVPLEAVYQRAGFHCVGLWRRWVLRSAVHTTGAAWESSFDDVARRAAHQIGRWIRLRWSQRLLAWRFGQRQVWWLVWEAADAEAWAVVAWRHRGVATLEAWGGCGNGATRWILPFLAALQRWMATRDLRRLIVDAVDGSLLSVLLQHSGAAGQPARRSLWIVCQRPELLHPRWWHLDRAVAGGPHEIIKSSSDLVDH